MPRVKKDTNVNKVLDILFKETDMQIDETSCRLGWRHGIKFHRSHKAHKVNEQQHCLVCFYG